MMSMNKILNTALSLVALGMTLAAEAQVTKQVEVTKEYVPEVAEAVKLPLQPNMVDTVKMRPEIDYAITPQMYATDLSTHKFKPATVTYWEFDRAKNFYAKVGAGYPLNTVADIYASANKLRVGYIMAYLNHLGEYGKRDNYLDKPTKAMQMHNHVGVAGGLYCGKRVFEGDVNYKSDIFHRFAGDGSEIDLEDVNMKLRFGDNFTDLSRINFDVSLYGNYFNDKAGWLAKEQRRLQEAYFGVKARVAREFNAHRVEFDAGYDGRWGLKDLGNYADNLAYVGLMYGYKSDFIELMAGFDYCYDRVKGRNKASHYLLPKAKVRLNLGRRNIAAPFLEVDSSVKNNSYHSLVQRNPYIQLVGRQFTMPNTINYDARFGIEGRLAKDKFAYRLYAGMSFIENDIYWYTYDYMWMRPVDDRRNILSLNLELEYKPINKLDIKAGIHGFLYTNWAEVKYGPYQQKELVNFENDMPPFDAYLRIRYDFGKVSIGASSDFVGASVGRSFVISDETQQASMENMKRVADFRMPFYANVCLDVDWQVSKMCTLFLEGRNLANMKIYRWAWYRDLGIHFTVGARVNF